MPLIQQEIKGVMLLAGVIDPDYRGSFTTAPQWRKGRVCLDIIKKEMRHQRNQCQKPLAGTMATVRPSPTPPGPPERADLAPSGPPLLWLHWSWNGGGGGAGGSHSRGRPRPPLRQSLRWLRVGPGGSRGEPAAARTSAVCILRRRPSSPTRGSHLSLRRSRSRADPAAAAATAGQSPSPGAAQPPSAKQPPPAA